MPLAAHVIDACSAYASILVHGTHQKVRFSLLRRRHGTGELSELDFIVEDRAGESVTSAREPGRGAQIELRLWWRGGADGRHSYEPLELRRPHGPARRIEERPVSLGRRHGGIALDQSLFLPVRDAVEPHELGEQHEHFHLRELRDHK